MEVFKRLVVKKKNGLIFQDIFLTYYNTKSIMLYENILKLINGKDLFHYNCLTLTVILKNQTLIKMKYFPLKEILLVHNVLNYVIKKVYESIDLFEKKKERKN